MPLFSLLLVIASALAASPDVSALPDHQEEASDLKQKQKDGTKEAKCLAPSKARTAIFDGFGQIAAEMEEASMDQSALLLKKNKGFDSKNPEKCERLSPEATTVAEARAAVSAVIAKAARPDLIERVDNITRLLQQLDQDLESIRDRKGLTPETIALVELSILREKEALLASVGSSTLVEGEAEGEVDANEGIDTAEEDPDKN